MAQPRKKHRRVADEPASEAPSTRFVSAPSTTIAADEASQLPLQNERASTRQGSTPEKQPEESSTTSGECSGILLTRHESALLQQAAVEAVSKEGGSPREQLAAAKGAAIAAQVKPLKRRSSVHICCCDCNYITLGVILSLGVGLWLCWGENAALKQQLRPITAYMPELDFPDLPLPFNLTQQAELLQSMRLSNMFASIDYPRPGIQLREQGLRPKLPVIIVPGFITSSLELWAGHPCAQAYFRQRVWGAIKATYAFLSDPKCWLEHMTLDEESGMDPEGVRIRSAEGLQAVDFFMPGYHVWAKMIEAFADLGYDSNNLISETYDWRLAIPNMEKRDSYYTRLKSRIETTKKIHNEKVLVVSHSWGDNVFRNFLVWVGAQDPRWCEEHIATYANVAGPTLGVAKAITSFLSGETRDTVELGYIAALLSNHLIGRASRMKLFKSWGSGIGMLPAGGPAIWGNVSWAPDDTPEMREKNVSYGTFLTTAKIKERHAQLADETNMTLSETITNFFAKFDKAAYDKATQKHDIDGAIKLLLDVAGPTFRRNARRWSAVHAEPRSCAADKSHPDEYYFSPLRCPLPDAPSMQMFCLYGFGLPTERSYHYLDMESDKVVEVANKEGNMDDRDRTPLDTPWKLNNEVLDEASGLDHGVMESDGDGTVPLLSLGTLCRKHWREPRLNPAGLRVVTREYPHKPWKIAPTSIDKLVKSLRGGPHSGQHVDILANEGVLMDILYMAAGRAHELEDDIHSDIDRIVEQIPTEAGPLEEVDPSGQDCAADNSAASCPAPSH